MAEAGAKFLTGLAVAVYQIQTPQSLCFKWLALTHSYQGESEAGNWRSCSLGWIRGEMVREKLWSWIYQASSEPYSTLQILPYSSRCPCELQTPEWFLSGLVNECVDEVKYPFKSCCSSWTCSSFSCCPWEGHQIHLTACLTLALGLPFTLDSCE